eukprot:Nitzschia sp. Nitz4//scaffold166_size90379//458//4141//NITZ4_005044-RA/size90379-processed-gene-0.37-mRNA-1//1//CDS//3329538157//3117//frame0
MMVLNSSGNGTNNAGNSSSSGRGSLSSNVAAIRRRRSKGTIAGFASGKAGESGGAGSSASSAMDTSVDPAGSDVSGSLSGSVPAATAPQPQHQNDSSAPAKPCHSTRLALMCCQNAIRMGARTQLGLCPPGRARRGLKSALTARLSRRRALPSQPSADTGGYFGVDKMLGSDVLDLYPTQEREFLSSPNAFDAESDEDASSGDDDDLNNLEELFKEDSPALDDEKKYATLQEPLFTPIGAENALANSTKGPLAGPAASGKLPFNRRKLRYFDSVAASDRVAARAYLKEELKVSKQRELALLARHLKRAQRQERRRIKEEQGISLDDTDLSDYEDEAKDKSTLQANVAKFDHAMLPSTAAALILESLALNPKESLEGMALCYDGIVAAGVALLEANVNDPMSTSSHNERTVGTRSEIMAALAPLLITSLEQPSGDVILCLARLRRMCGTARYQRRFVQRVAPALIRPPNGAMWCLKHQNDMEPILAACELIFDCASAVFSKGWYDRGQLILADSKRAETLNAAAMQLRNLSTGPSESLTLGASLGGHGGWRSTRVHKDGTKGSNETLAEWEVIAVDRQIRISISNLISMDWTKVVVQNRDAELARSYHRARSVTKRPTVLPSGSGDISPKTIVTTPLSPARPSGAKTPSSPMAAPPPPSEKVDTPDPSLQPTIPEAMDPRSKSPIPPSGPPPSQPPPLSPPPPNRAASDDIESKLPSEQPMPFLSSVHTPPRSPTPKHTSAADAFGEPPAMPSWKSASSPLSPRRTPGPQPHFKESISGPPASSPGTPQEKHSTPLSPSSVGTTDSATPARFMSSASSVSSSLAGTLGTQPAHYRMLTSTAAERKRTVAACRALRAQITRFEDAFMQLHGRPPKGAAERAPLATTYAQYREWKRAIRADAACRIQALFRGARARWSLLRSQDPRVSRVILARAGRQSFSSASANGPAQTTESVLNRLSIPSEIGEPVADKSGASSPVAAAGAIGPDGFPVQGASAQALPPQWGNQIVRRRSGGSEEFTTSNSPVPRPASSGASVSSTGSGDMSRLSFSELQARKRDLKQQLKQYDMNFARRHGRMPVKAEKEPIRHLYERYNALKSQITNIERDGSRTTSPASSVQGGSSSSLSRSPAPVSTTELTPEDSPVGMRQSRPAQRSPPGSTASSADTTLQDLASLKAEKGRLHQMLRAYEKKFFKEHKRQVSSFTDIRPVAGQYRKYKEIKRAISALEQGV